MKDIGIFPTQYGVATLILREIPYRQEAYIRVQDVQPGELIHLLGECAAFCRACGAEKIFWTGAECEEVPAMCVLRMRGTAWVDGRLLEQLFPVTAETAARWRSLYNERMRSVPQAKTLSFADEKGTGRTWRSILCSSCGRTFGNRLAGGYASSRDCIL